MLLLLYFFYLVNFVIYIIASGSVFFCLLGVFCDKIYSFLGITPSAYI